MDCRNIELLLVEYLDGTLDDQHTEAVKMHLSACTECTKTLQAFQELSVAMQECKQEMPPAGFKERFQYNLQQESAKEQMFEKQKRPAAKMFSMSRFPYNIAASILLFIGGLTIGYLLKNSNGSGHGKQTEIAELRTEVKEMKKAVMFALLNNESASERIKAVGYVEEIKQPDLNMINALLQTINNDENVNVRLAALYSVAKFSNIDVVSDSLLASLPKQKDPIIQIVMINLLANKKADGAKKTLQNIINDKNAIEPVKEAAEKGMQML